MEANIEVADVESSDLSSEEGKLKMKCLLVNDCPKKLLMMTSVLKLANFEVDQATNGFQAFQMMQKSLQGDNPKRYTLVLMDLDMPISDGFDGCQKIRTLFKNNKKLVQYKSRKYYVKGNYI